jgi:hypothetical protein
VTSLSANLSFSLRAACDAATVADT